MANEKMPIQGIERAGILFGHLVNLVTASLAMIGHALDITTTGAIRLGPQVAAVGVHHHAKRVGQFDPLEGIHVDRQVPLTNRGWHDTGQQGEVAGNHQPLNMVSVAQPQGLPDGLRHAAHAGAPGPVERWQRPVVVQVIEPGIRRHALPIDATHILTPADQLANEAFGCIERHPPLAPGFVDVVAQTTHIQKPDVERRTDARMKQVRLAFGHRVLVVTESRQAEIQKMLPQLLCLGMGHGVVETVDAPVVVAEALTHQGHHRCCDVVLREMRSERATQLPWQWLAIVAIEIPGPTCRAAVRLHEQAGSLAHATVEVLHTQLATFCGPAPEGFTGAQKTRVAKPHKRQCGITQGLLQAPLTALGQVNVGGAQGLLPSTQLTHDAAAVTLGVQLDIVHLPTPFTQGLGKMPHGAEDENDLQRMMRYVSGLPLHFRHQDRIASRVKGRQTCQVERQLVTQHQAQAHRPGYHWLVSVTGTRSGAMGPSRCPHISSCTTCCTSMHGTGGRSASNCRSSVVERTRTGCPWASLNVTGPASVRARRR